MYYLSKEEHTSSQTLRDNERGKCQPRTRTTGRKHTSFLFIHVLQGETCQFLDKPRSDKSLSDGISNLADNLEAIHTDLHSDHFAL